MGPFDHIQKKGSIAIRPQPAQIRKEVISTVSSVPKTSLTTPERNLPGGRAKISPPSSVYPKGRSKDTRKKSSNLQQRLESDSDDDDQGSDIETDSAPRKRQRINVDAKPDSHRKIRNGKSFPRDIHGTLAIVHAADIATVRYSTKYRPAFTRTPHLKQVELHYPSACAMER